ncbi:hypothetical protein, partial [Parabacteroides distasonis]|uniref:hypothetical protein n=1 Tax=Parabacteroides distasonis TaxID=823 RepID=UPI0034A432F6
WGRGRPPASFKTIKNPPADGLPPPKQLKILQRTVCRLQSDQKSTGEPSADSKTAKNPSADRLPASKRSKNLRPTACRPITP